MIRYAAVLLFAGCLAAGCETSQSVECQDYIECRRAFDEEAGNQRADLAAYEFDGDCWVDADAAADCTATCKEDLASLKEDVASNDFDLAACK